MAKTYYKYKDRKSAPIDYAGASQGLSESIQGTVDKLKAEADKAGAEAREAQLLAKETAERQVKDAYARLDKERERARQIRKDAEARAEKKDLASTTFYTKAVEGLSQVEALGMATKGDANDYLQTNVLGIIPQIKEKALELTKDYTSGAISQSDFLIGKTQMLDQIKMLKIVSDSSLTKINQTNERIANGEASPIEPYLINKSQEFQDWKKRKLMFSPENNTIYAVSKSSDDPIDGPPEEPKYLSLSENFADIQNQYNAYDMDAETTAYADLVEDITIDVGGVKITDPFQTAGGANLMASIKSKFGAGVSATDKASVLLRKEGYFIIDDVWTEEQYEEWKKAASKEEIRGGIWLKRSGLERGRVNAVLQENQEKAFLDEAINEIRIKAGYSKTVDAPKKQTDVERKAQAETDKMIAYGDALHRVFTDTDKTGASAAIASIIGDDFVGLTFSDDGKTGTLTVMQGSGEDRKEIRKAIDLRGSYSDFVKNYGGALLNIKDVARYETELIGDRGTDKAGEKAKGGYSVETDKKLETDVTIEDALEVVDSELDDRAYWTTSPVVDMSDSAKDMFDKLELREDMYTISSDGDIITIQVGELPPHDFNTKKDGHNNDHDQRRRAFLNLMKNIYKELTTGKPHPQSATESGMKKKKLNG